MPVINLFLHAAFLLITYFGSLLISTSLTLFAMFGHARSVVPTSERIRNICNHFRNLRGSETILVSYNWNRNLGKRNECIYYFAHTPRLTTADIIDFPVFPSVITFQVVCGQHPTHHIYLAASRLPHWQLKLPSSFDCHNLQANAGIARLGFALTSVIKRVEHALHLSDDCRHSWDQAYLCVTFDTA